MLQVFNDNTKHLQRERAAADVEASRKVDYLRDEVANRLCERLLVLSPHPTHFTASKRKHIGHKPTLPPSPRPRRECL